MSVSKIIQKEKEQQEANLEYCGMFVSGTGDEHCNETERCEPCRAAINQHKQSLINLKEYLEEVFDWFDAEDPEEFTKRFNQLKEDIAELTKIIGRYK